MGLLNDFSPSAVAIDLSATDYVNPNGHLFGVYVGTAGTVVIDTVESSSITVKAQAGQVLPWAVRKVYKTGTTATDLLTVKLP